MAAIKDLVNAVKGKELTDEELANRAVDLAEAILSSATKRQSLSERYQGWKMARMMEDPTGKALTLAMADQVFRPATHTRSAEQFRYLVDEYGVPEYLPLHERLAMRVGATMSALAPDIVMPAVTSKMRAESSKVILPSEDAKLKPHLLRRKKSGTRMNINQLGEAILGEEEAAHRLQQVVERLESPDCEYISVKISAIFSQINLVAYDVTLEKIKERLRLLYRTAMANTFTRADGSQSPKFVNLDMEEYRDLHLTCDAFKQVLMEKEFMGMRAGIVLQAYLPDSFEVQKDLTAWAAERSSKGGETIKVRIVKGANLAMEAVEASIHDWEQAPYYTKADVDANYKRMVVYGCMPEHAKVVRLGIASHNLFEVSYALLLRSLNNVEEFIEFEMLEGMANHQARAVQEIADGLLLYAPVVKKEDFHSAISYLVRRLDENTAEENFLHDLFGMKPGCPKWHKQREMFITACERKDIVSAVPNRTQNRNIETFETDVDSKFHNAADTDWSLRHNMRWILEKVEDFKGAEIPTIPVQIGGKEEVTIELGIGRDPSRDGVGAYKYSLTDADGVNSALDCAVAAQPEWEALGLDGRRRLLKEVATVVARRRGESIATMVLDGGKAAPEGDAEVSEAVDFANYYADSMSWDGLYDGTEFKPFGTVVVTPPWNFPFAIPLGGILAALMAGNTVIIKPAPEAVLTAWVMVNQIWEAGIPKEVVQFVACPDNEIGRGLVTDERVGAVILTGAYETGRMFQDWKPEMRLFAETSGKNSLIITNAADPDQAVKDLVKSAFGHAGQKCSAASLAILEGDVYDDPAFLRQLRDAAASLQVGPSWEETSIVTPVIRKPDPNLERALTTLDDGEEWLLEPKMVDNNPCLWTPGIKLGVKPDSWYRRTECFGPVLGLVRANNLDHAIRIQNDSDFGLTGGIHSLDRREVAQWRDKVEVGNAYINRSITGAIVNRQPFGGWKKSCFGPGAKAGGPNYVAQFATWEQASAPTIKAAIGDNAQRVLGVLSKNFGDLKELLEAAAASYAHWWNVEFSQEHDPTDLHGEDNHFRYVPVSHLCVRADGISDPELALVILAATTAGVKLDVSVCENRPWLNEFGSVNVMIESEIQLTRRLQKGTNYTSLRAPEASIELRRTANEAALQLIDWKVLANGRLELLHYVREQSISETTHRYGNIIPTPEECMSVQSN